jgi:hypothetical protein
MKITETELQTHNVPGQTADLTKFIFSGVDLSTLSLPSV